MNDKATVPILGLVILGAALVGGFVVASSRVTVTSRPLTSDIDTIKDVIEEAFLLRGDACLQQSHGLEDSFKQQMSDYWSATPPAGDELATREAVFEEWFATPDATEEASTNATAIAEYEAGEITAELLAEILGHTYPTPGWGASYSPLEERESEIDECQELPEALPIAFGIDAVEYTQTTIDGDSAEFCATVSFWADFENADSTIDRSDVTRDYTFYLGRENGVWKLTGENEGARLAP